MQNWAVIEISSVTEGSEPIQLLHCAYRASQSGLVALVLNGVEPRAADRILDPVVADMPLTIPGVEYVSIDDDARVRDAVLSAGIVFVMTRRFRSAVLGLGVDRERIWPVRSILTRLGQEPRSRSVQWHLGNRLGLHRHLQIRHVGPLPEAERA
ncbi:hypothetical protein K32_16180 [Kaistia sp. 32K]|nr:hypothetical protein K32_16180 [Kaistia sp. 32K]